MRKIFLITKISMNLHLRIIAKTFDIFFKKLKITKQAQTKINLLQCNVTNETRIQI